MTAVPRTGDIAPAEAWGDADLDALRSATARAWIASHWWTLLAWAAGAAALGVQIYLLWGADHPSFPFDEVTMLQMARIIAGEDAPLIRGAGYFPGWSVVIAPLWWFLADPQQIYVASLWVGLALSMATALPLAAVAGRMGLSKAQAYFAAFVVVALPAHAVQSDFVLSERLLFLVVACAALAVWRLHERPTAARAIVLGAVVAAAYFTHLRAITVVGATGVWLVLFAWRRWRIALIGIAALVASTAIAHVLGNAIAEAALGGPLGQQDGLIAALKESTPVLILKIGFAQAWHQIVGSFGVAAIGLVGAIMATWRQLRRWDAGPAMWVIGSVAATTIVSVISWSGTSALFTDGWRRLDAWIYARYLDPVVGIVVLLGIALLITGARRIVAWWSLGVTAGVSAIVLVFVAPIAATWGYVTPAHIAGVMPWYGLLPDERFEDGTALLPTFTNDNRFWLWASVCSLAIPVLMVLGRRTELAAALMLAVAATSGSIASDAATDDFHALEGVAPMGVATLQDAILAQGDVTAIYDWSCARDGHTNAVGENYYGWWLVPAVTERAETATMDTVDVDVVVGCVDWERAEELDALEFPDAQGYQSAVWILPGALQDTLIDDGLLARP